ncbi:MAG: hypothetical protein QOD58_985, partial [Mycobacterium sp.]|nr:hypothetical protein [Mycobacterium sp.]
IDVFVVVPNIAFGMHCGSFGNAANLGWSRLGFELPLVSRLAAAATTDQVCRR